MKRTEGTKNRTKLTMAGLFLVVALASAGCGNALMNPQVDQTAASGGNETAQNGRQLTQPGGQLTRP